MARTDHGNNLATPQLQAGWTVNADGFGLVQIKAQFKWDYNYFIASTVSNGYFQRGKEFGVTAYQYCRMHKWDYVEEKNGVVTINAEYVGVDPEYTVEGGGYITLPQVQMVGSSSAEDISHHPNFIKLNCTSNGLTNVLAGPPPPGGVFVDNTSTNPNRALWTPIVANQGAINNCQFVAFLPAKDTTNINIKAGVKSYYKPQSTLRVLIYVSHTTEAEAASLALLKASYVGWSTNGSLFNLPAEYKKLAQTTGGYLGNFTYTEEYEAKINRSFLVTNCSVEKFGWVYKVTADLMLSGIAGWDRDIYPKVPSPG